MQVWILYCVAGGGRAQHLIGLRHNNDRRRARVDAPLLLGGRHTLHAVDARLVAQPQEGARAGERGTGELAAAGVCFGLLDDLQGRALVCEREAAPGSQVRVDNMGGRRAGGSSEGTAASWFGGLRE